MKNLKYKLILFFCLLPFSAAFAQPDDASLPGWLFKTENYNRVNVAIGISDPNPDTTLAIEQAKINALINYSILHDAVFTSLTNVGMGTYTDSDKPSSNLEYIIFTSIIKGKLPPLSSVNIKEKYFTRYNEAIVLIELNNNIDSSVQIPDYTITRRAGFQKENNSFPLFADEMDIEVHENDSVIMNLGIEKDGIKYRDTKDEKENRFYYKPQNLRALFFYPNCSFLDNESKLPSMGTSLNYGIWKSFIFNLIDQISIFNSMNINCQYKLTSTNIGNANIDNQTLTFQQLVYSLKNLNSTKLSNSIAEISLANNRLNIAIKSAKNQNASFSAASMDKANKKIIKKLKSEKWISFGEDDIETAWLKATNLSEINDQFLNTEVEIQSGSLQSGIIEGFQLAKLHLSSQLATKISSLGKTDIGNEDQSTVKSAKLINIEKTGNIGPYFIFYQNPSPNIYNIKIKVLYDLKQLGEL
jgi:hypothetical protein